MKKGILLAAAFVTLAVGPAPASAESGVVVTEVMANPLSEDDGEFIEVYNASAVSVDLSGWTLTDGDALDTIVAWDPAAHKTLRDADAKTGTLVLPPLSFAVILDSEYAAGEQPYDFPVGAVVATVANTTLGNGLTTNDPITLYNSAKVVVATYGTPVSAADWHDADDDGKDGIPFDPGNGVSAERKDVAVGDVELNWEASTSVSGSTPGSLRVPPQEPEGPEDNPDENDGKDSDTPPATPPSTPPDGNEPTHPPAGENKGDDSQQESNDQEFSSDIHLNEVFPNPEGSDDGEFIELRNDGNKTVSLVGWTLADASRSHTIEEAIISPRGFLVFDRETTGLALNNSGSETVELRDPSGAAKDTVEYNGAKEGSSYSFVEDAWVWTETPTPGEKNVFSVENSEPNAAIQGPELAIVGEKVLFDAGDSKDADKEDELTFSWDFGDGERCAEERCEHVFDSEGKYTVILRVTDSFGGEDEAELAVNVRTYDLSRDIFFSEVVVNPEGSDEAGEWIEIVNVGNHDADLFGWTVTDEKTFFRFKDTTIISRGEFFALTRDVSDITLNNSSERLYLIDPKGVIREGVDIRGGKEGMSFAKNDARAGWVWVETPTRGKANALSAGAGEEDESGGVSGATMQSSGAQSQSGKKSSGIVKGATAVASIADLRTVSKGSSVSFFGNVTAAPGEVSPDFFFVQDESGGVEVYSSSRAFPELSRGAHVEVNGKISKSAQEFRVNISSEEDIRVKEGSEEIIPLADSSPEDHDGALVTFSGEIISKRGLSWNVSTDGGDEIPVKFLTSGAVELPYVLKGQTVSVTGIVRIKKGAPELLPRSADDVVVAQQEERPIEETASAIREQSPSPEESPSSPLVPLLAAGYVLPIGALAYMYKMRVHKKQKEEESDENWHIKVQ